MGVGAGLYMCDVVKKFTFAISSPDEFLFSIVEEGTRKQPRLFHADFSQDFSHELSGTPL